jgi:hypothetical protein
MKSMRLAVFVSALAVLACSGQSVPTGSAPAQTGQPTSAATPTATAVPTATPTALATATAEPSLATPSPSEAPASPTASAEASPTPTVTATGLIEVVGGAGSDAPANGLAFASVRLQRPTAIAFAADGTMWVVDSNGGLLLHVLADGSLADVTAGLVAPSGVTVTTDGKVYIGERGNYRVDRYNGHGGIDVVGGDEHFPGSGGDGGPLSKANFSQPTQVLSDEAGNIYINDLFNEKIRWVDADTNIIDRVAGNGTAGFSGDDGPAIDAQISAPAASVVDAGGTQLLIGDSRNMRLRRVDLASGIIKTIGGTGSGSTVRFDPNLTAAQAPLIHLSALALDGAGNIYLPVQWGDLGLMIERLDPTGHLTPLGGGGTTAVAAGVAPQNMFLGDVLCLAVNPESGDVLFCSPDGHIYNMPGAAIVAGP